MNALVPDYFCNVPENTFMLLEDHLSYVLMTDQVQCKFGTLEIYNTIYLPLITDIVAHLVINPTDAWQIIQKERRMI